MGLKFLRDGVDSANLVAMLSVDGQASWNFFENDWRNHIPFSDDKTKWPLAQKFATATPWIQTVGLSDYAEYDQTGKRFEPVFPWELRFEPTGKIEFPKEFDKPYTEQLATIPRGKTLFRVYALDKPTELGGTERQIGVLVTDSEMITSNWGDENLFFRH